MQLPFGVKGLILVSNSILIFVFILVQKFVVISIHESREGCLLLDKHWSGGTKINTETMKVVCVCARISVLQSVNHALAQ
jgi:hypothetical protein